MALTNKQTRFVRGIHKGLNGTQAAKQAGYSAPHVAASQMLKLPKIIKAIEELSKKTDRLHIATIEERKEILTKIVFNQKETARARCTALDLLNKMDAVYLIRTEQAHAVKMSPEQLEEKAIEVYRQNPELWERIKKGVEGSQDDEMGEGGVSEEVVHDKCGDSEDT